MTNDTAVFGAMRFDIRTGENVWTGRTGTPASIRRDGLSVDSMSLGYCPHEWLDSKGYVDHKLVQENPYK